MLYEEYKEANPNNYYCQTQFREYYAKFLNKINSSMKQVHLADEKMFVDYSGLKISIVNQKTGEITKAQILQFFLLLFHKLWVIHQVHN